jgi:hypothetical protein
MQQSAGCHVCGSSAHAAVMLCYTLVRDTKAAMQYAAAMWALLMLGKCFTTAVQMLCYSNQC